EAGKSATLDLVLQAIPQLSSKPGVDSPNNGKLSFLGASPGEWAINREVGPCTNSYRCNGGVLTRTLAPAEREVHSRRERRAPRAGAARRTKGGSDGGAV